MSISWQDEYETSEYSNEYEEQAQYCNEYVEQVYEAMNKKQWITRKE